MAAVPLLSDAEAESRPDVALVFADIRETRGSPFVNNFWRALAAADPDELARVWADVKRVMTEPGTLDPLTRELVYIAVSATNGCAYCAHSHTAAARAKGMSVAQHGELLRILALAARTNQIANALQVPIDPQFER